MHSSTAWKSLGHLHHVRLLDQLWYGLSQHQKLIGEPIERLRPLRVRPTLVDFRLKAIGLLHPYIAEGIGDEEEALHLKRLYVTVRDLNIWAVFSTKPRDSSNTTGIGNTVDTDGFACPSQKLRTSCP